MRVVLVQVEVLVLAVGVQIRPRLVHPVDLSVHTFQVQLTVLQARVIHQLVQRLCQVHHPCHRPVHLTHRHLLVILQRLLMLEDLRLQVLVTLLPHPRTLQLHRPIHQHRHLIPLHHPRILLRRLHIAQHHPPILLPHHRILPPPPRIRRLPPPIHQPHLPTLQLHLPTVLHLHLIVPLRHLTVQPHPLIHQRRHHTHPPRPPIPQLPRHIVQRHLPTRQHRPTTVLHPRRILHLHLPIPPHPQVILPSQTETTPHRRHRIPQVLLNTRLPLLVILQPPQVTHQPLQNTVRRHQPTHQRRHRIHRHLQNIPQLLLPTRRHLPHTLLHHQITLPLHRNILQPHLNIHLPPHNTPHRHRSTRRLLLNIHQVHLSILQILQHLPITLPVHRSILHPLLIIPPPLHNIPRAMTIAQLHQDTLLHLQHTVRQRQVVLQTFLHSTHHRHHSIPHHLQATRLPHQATHQHQHILPLVLCTHPMPVKSKRRRRSDS